jgi:ParB-like chromosome segregation protein Spo0J
MENINDLKIDPEFRDLFPPLTEEEYGLLEDHIVEIGHLIEPIVVWKDLNIIVDGHNRYQICKKLDIEIKIQEMEFRDREDVKAYIIKHHMGRRSLSLFQRIEAALKMEKIFVEQAKANQSAGGGAVKQKSAEPINVPTEIAKLAGCSHDTVSRVKKILKEANQADIDNLRNGKAKINTLYKKLEQDATVAMDPIDAQEKRIMSWIEDIENKMSKVAKIKNEIPESLLEQARGKITLLVSQIFGS